MYMVITLLILEILLNIHIRINNRFENKQWEFNYEVLYHKILETSHFVLSLDMRKIWNGFDIDISSILIFVPKITDLKAIHFMYTLQS